MNPRIAQALEKLFSRHRIVFWYDAARELRHEFESLEFDDVRSLEIRNNEFFLKYHILREQPQQKFLLYNEGPQPADLDNWLLDVQLAHAEFRTDQAALWLSELDLGLEFADVVQQHPEFFQAAKRREALRKLLKPDDTPLSLRLKLLAVCAAAEPRLDTILEQLLHDLSQSRDERLRLITRCGLEKFLFEQLARTFSYRSDSPGLRDFVIELFKSTWAMGTDGSIRMSGDALVFLKRWKDSRQYSEGFEFWSTECAEVLAIESDLANRDARDLLELDSFRLVDLKIISTLVHSVTARTIVAADVAPWVRQRRQSHWFPEFRHLYEAIDHAAALLEMHGVLSSQWTEQAVATWKLSDWIERYTSTWYRLDQLYRRFIWHVRMSAQPSLLGPLTELVENQYINNCLLRLADRFQNAVDTTTSWHAPPFRRQDEFFETCVNSFLRREIKVCVIISDALRYEAGEELLTAIRQEDRYTAELEPLLAMLPSYTQLGMAALLPHKTLEIAPDDSGIVLVNGQSSQGTANRNKLLSDAAKGRGAALRADDLLAMKADDCRSLIRDHDVLYIYHNRIDFVGDKRETEERVFEAVEEAIQELVRVVRKLTAANASNLLVTADHGFLCQHRAVDESDFTAADAEGHQVLLRDRRFVVGQQLRPNPSFRLFKATELGLVGSLDIQIPRSINRLRVRGSGSRFVHGGASLQEVVVPLLRINKRRQSDVAAVEVEILRGTSSVITAGQLAVTLYQTLPVTDKLQPRILRAGLYTTSGELISDAHELTFDLDSENPRDRERQVRFVLTSRADKANGQEVILRLEEQHAGTSHYREYKSLRYTIRRSFTSDFEF